MKAFSRSWRVVGILALVLLVLSLAACGAVAPQTQAPAQNENQAAPPDEEEEEAEETPVIVVVTATTGPEVVEPTAAPPEAATATTDPAAQPTAVPPTTAPPAGGQNTGPVTENESWNPVIEERDGVEWVLVPTGTFTMGNRNGPPAELPEHTVEITAPFWLMRTEVWNELYGGESLDWAWRDAMAPAANYTWEEALAFCQTLGGRLPTEAEWEWAAKGPSNWPYTMGEILEPGFIVNANNYQSPQPVGPWIENASWVGALDMLGNVSEWTSSGGGEDYPYVATDGRENSPAAGNPMRVHRGGSQQTGEGNLRNALREWYRFDSSTNFIGMRCAMDYQP